MHVIDFLRPTVAVCMRLTAPREATNFHARCAASSLHVEGAKVKASLECIYYIFFFLGTVQILHFLGGRQTRIRRRIVFFQCAPRSGSTGKQNVAIVGGARIMLGVRKLGEKERVFITKWEICFHGCDSKISSLFADRVVVVGRSGRF